MTPKKKQQSHSKLSCDDSVRGVYFALKQRRRLEPTDFDLLVRVLDDRYPQLKRSSQHINWWGWTIFVMTLTIIMYLFI